eukprot:908667-Rhodomonas_salina.1
MQHFCHMLDSNRSCPGRSLGRRDRRKACLHVCLPGLRAQHDGVEERGQRASEPARERERGRVGGKGRGRQREGEREERGSGGEEREPEREREREKRTSEGSSDCSSLSLPPSLSLLPFSSLLTTRSSLVSSLTSSPLSLHLSIHLLLSLLLHEA